MSETERKVRFGKTDVYFYPVDGEISAMSLTREIDITVMKD